MRVFVLYINKIISCERKSEQTHIPHAPSLFENAACQRMAIPSISEGQSDRKPVSSELNKIILAKVQKGYKLLLKKIKSAFPVKMHIYT